MQCLASSVCNALISGQLVAPFCALDSLPNGSLHRPAWSLQSQAVLLCLSRNREVKLHAMAVSACGG